MIDLHYSSTDETLVFQATGILTSRDYEMDFEPIIERAIIDFGKVNLVMILDTNFEGWDLGAMWDDARFGLRHRHDFNRIAVVGAQTWFKWALNLGSAFLDGQFRTFALSDFELALTWAIDGSRNAKLEKIPESTR